MGKNAEQRVRWQRPPRLQGERNRQQDHQFSRARLVIDSLEWRMYLMDSGDVEREVLRLHQFHRLSYQAAGTLATLDLPAESLLERDTESLDLDGFPDSWAVHTALGDLSLRLTYRFDPGAAEDGVTVHVPLLVLNRLDSADFSWFVPGRRLELVTELIRSLPKALRRQVVPATDFAQAFLADASPVDGSLLPVLAAAVTRRSGVTALHPMGAFSFGTPFTNLTKPATKPIKQT